MRFVINDHEEETKINYKVGINSGVNF